MRAISAVLMSLPILFAVSCTSDSSPAPQASVVPPAGTTNTVLELIKSDYIPGEITELCGAEILSLKNDLGKEGLDLFKIENRIAEFIENVDPMTFMAYVSTDGAMRKEASACEEKYTQVFNELFTSRDLYKSVKSTEVSGAAQTRLKKDYVNSFESNGMSLSDANLAVYKELKDKLASLETKFSSNLNEAKDEVLYTEAQLAGVSASFKKSLKKNADGLFAVAVNGPNFIHIMQNASDPMARKMMQVADENVAAEENSALLNEAVQLRRQIAKLLGYSSWAAYRTKDRMAKKPENVLGLLNDLKAKLRPRLENDLAILLKAKQEMENPEAKEVKAWDIRYFENQVKKTNFKLDTELIRQYFPKDTVMDGMFKIYSTLLDVEYAEVKEASVWAKGVKLYEVREKKTDKLLSYFFTDFFPREGKYGHAAAFTLRKGRNLNDGSYMVPISSIVSNFTPPADGKPSLLTFREVETLFHEFGHIMHQVLTKAPYGSLAGTSVARDFVEAPSQMLENWVWDAEMLAMISGHYQDSSQKLPAEIVKKMLEAKDFNLGHFYARQMTFGLTDMLIHTTEENIDVNEVYKSMHKDVMTFDAVSSSHFMATFGHMMGGYDAGYYGYIWSEVYAADMFTSFELGGLLNKQLGWLYRTTILEQGGMKDALSLISEFLGREPNNKAFLKKLGL